MAGKQNNSKKKKANASFAEQADTQAPSFLRELLDFLIHNKKWWLAPIIIVLLLISILVLLTSNSALAPFIYALF